MPATATVLREITGEEALKLLEEVVAGNEDFVYERQICSGGGETCTYSIPEGLPSCIVGHVLYKIDPKIIEAFSKWEWNQEYDEQYYVVNGGTISTDAVKSKLRELGYVLDSEAAWILSSAQTRQDAGFTWGEALGSAFQASASGKGEYT